MTRNILTPARLSLVMAAEPLVQAAHGETTGKPGFEALRGLLNEALHVDPRFDTDSHGYPEGSPGDVANEPYVVDLLVPDDDGAAEAVVRDDKGGLWRVGYTWDGDKVELSQEAPTPTRPTVVYAAAIAQHEATVKAKASPAPGVVLHCRDNGEEIKAASSKPWEVDEPVEFQWMPGGVKTITAHYQDRPLTITVKCDERTAKTVQASLDRWKQDMPQQEPFGCVEHREQEASLRPRAFAWREGSVYCTALPTALGAKNVNGRIHRSWSPSFGTDADYSALKCSCGKPPSCKCGGALLFPPKARGGSENPAEVTGVGFSVGSLTNKPAFRDIAPVRAAEAQGVQPISASPAGQANDPQPGSATAVKRKETMKVKFVKARGQYTVGQEAELDATASEIQDGYAMPAAGADLVLAATARAKASDLGVIKAAFKRAVDRGAIAPKDEAPLVKANERYEKGADAELLAELFDGLQGSDKSKLQQRLSKPFGDKVQASSGIQLQGVSLRDAGDAYVKCFGPQNALIRAGNFAEASKLSIEAAEIAQSNLLPIIRAGDDYALRDAIKAADTSDPDSQVGTLATGLVLMRNLGFLKNKLAWLPYLTTDLRNEPAQFGQNIITRYLAVPDVLTYVPGVGYTSDASTISTASSGTVQTGQAYQASGTRTPSVPSATDVSVTINQHKAVELRFALNKLASTVRNLFAEQLSAQIYGLAEKVNTSVLATLFGATWTGTVKAMSIPLATWNLTGLARIKNRMTMSKIPDVGRFALLNSIWHDGLLTDTNLVNAKAILALINKDMSAFESGDIPAIYGVKPIESQLAAANTAGALVSVGFNDTTGEPILTDVDKAGFAGNMSSAVFASRVPQDYTSLAAAMGVPATAAVEIITEPDSGLSMLIVRYVDNGTAEVKVRAALMWGSAQGDPRQGFVLKAV